MAFLDAYRYDCLRPGGGVGWGVGEVEEWRLDGGEPPESGRGWQQGGVAAGLPACPRCHAQAALCAVLDT